MNFYKKDMEQIMEINNDFFPQLILEINNVRFNKKYFNAYSIQEVDQFLEDLINIMSSDIEFKYKIKELKDLDDRKKFSLSFLGYNKNEVDEFLDNILKRIKV